MMKKRILLVEDEKDMMEMVKFRLEQAGFEVITAYDGETVMDTLNHKLPDLILLDLMLPRIDGYEVCRRLKADEQYKKVPIAMFTARASESDKKRGYEVGADAYITKPFEPGEFLNKIRQLLN